MNDNERVISSSLVVTLVAVTKEAIVALGGDLNVRIRKFPFKVGQESRGVRRLNPAIFANPPAAEPRRGSVPSLNDLYLVEAPWADLGQISREHFAIEYTENHFFLVDRGSMHGTVVAGKVVGGDGIWGRAELRGGDKIIVETDASPYVCQFDVVQPE